jgi:hypothetical protein
VALAVVKDSHLTFNGIQYFRASSESLTIGTYGEKRTPITKPNYLEAQADLPAPKLVVTSATIVGIDFTNSTSVDVKLHLKPASSGYSGSADVAYNELKSGALKLVKFEMRLDAVKQAFNGAPTALNNLRSYGNDARAVHQIFVVLKATEATTVTTASSFTFSKDNNTLKVTVGTSNATVVTFSAGTTYAYLLANPDWDRGKDVIEKFTDDQWSFS